MQCGEFEQGVEQIECAFAPPWRRVARADRLPASRSSVAAATWRGHRESGRIVASPPLLVWRVVSHLDNGNESLPQRGGQQALGGLQASQRAACQPLSVRIMSSVCVNSASTSSARSVGLPLKKLPSN